MGVSFYFLSISNMTSFKKITLSSVALALTINQAFANNGSSMFGGDKVSVGGAAGTADTAIQSLLRNAMLFLGIVAVLYGVYGGFLMVTAGGEEEKMKKGRTILIQVAIGLVVIFLANSIVQWVLSQVLK